MISKKTRRKYYTIYKNGTKGWGELKKLTEFEFLLDDFLEICEIDLVDKVNLSRISERISDMIRYNNIIFYFSAFHYFYNYITHDNYGEKKIQHWKLKLYANLKI